MGSVRAYGVDETDRYSTVVEATKLDDGSVEFRVVIVEHDEGHDG